MCISVHSLWTRIPEFLVSAGFQLLVLYSYEYSPLVHAIDFQLGLDLVILKQNKHNQHHKDCNCGVIEIF